GLPGTSRNRVRQILARAWRTRSRRKTFVTLVLRLPDGVRQSANVVGPLAPAGSSPMPRPDDLAPTVPTWRPTEKEPHARDFLRSGAEGRPIGRAAGRQSVRPGHCPDPTPEKVPHAQPWTLHNHFMYKQLMDCIALCAHTRSPPN